METTQISFMSMESSYMPSPSVSSTPSIDGLDDVDSGVLIFMGPVIGAFIVGAAAIITAILAFCIRKHRKRRADNAERQRLVSAATDTERTYANQV